MNFNDRNDLIKNGFKGFVRIGNLLDSLHIIPKKPGIYLVLNPNHSKVHFINPGTGGFFKNKNPNVSIEKLEQEHVPDSLVVYIGKAGGKEKKSNLRKRIRELLLFGKGKKIGHWGGRILWQIDNSDNFIICWRVIEDEEPEAVEKHLIQRFEEQFGKKPFANLRS